MGRRQRIAVIGSGVAGLVAAHLLSQRHDVIVFEADGRVGGHTHTVRVQQGGREFAVDTGFIVYNERNYPGFSRLLQRLGVASQPTSMSFSVHCERSGLEYNGSSLDQLFAQRSNLLRPRFWRMLWHICRFNREALAVLQDERSPSLQELLQERRYGREFEAHYLLPMGAAIWSCEARQLLQMPGRFFVQFFHNHGMLQVRGRPQWRVIQGGSSNYLGPLCAPFAAGIRLRTPVLGLWRRPDGVALKLPGEPEVAFDAAVVATHSDQALRLLHQPTPAEQRVLSAIRYQPNDVVLHTDTSLLPERRRAWAAWNYRIPASPKDRVAVTYCMNLLQGLPLQPTFCVTLNQTERIAEADKLQQFRYDHPVFDAAAVAAQGELPKLQGDGGVYYCGAWCGNGFHEDGVQSALGVAAAFGCGLDVTAREAVGAEQVA